MEERIWYQSPQVIVTHALDFFPIRRPDQNDAEYINTLTRFVLYASVSLFVVTRQATIVIGGLLVIALLSIVYEMKRRSGDLNREKNPRKYCRPPTADNPLQNITTDEYGQGPWPPCQGDEIEREKNRLLNTARFTDLDDYPNTDFNERQFITLPNAGYGPDFASFSAELAKGSTLIDR